MIESKDFVVAWLVLPFLAWLVSSASAGPALAAPSVAQAAGDPSAALRAGSKAVSADRKGVAAATAPLAAAYIAPMSHLDLTFMGTQEECLSRGGKVFAGALGLLDTQADFRFFMEYVLFLEAYRAAQPTEAARLDKYIRAGRVELGAEWSGIYVAQEDEEDLIRNILYAKAYAREHYGIELDTLQLTDIPGVIPQLPQVCAGLGVGNLVLTRCAPPDKLFWYEAPGGSRVLVWSAKGYNQAGVYKAHVSADAMRKQGLAERLAAAAQNGVPPLLYYGSDQWLPPPGLVPAVRDWNAKALPQQQLAITTPSEYFRVIRAAGLAEKAPLLRGELPSTWLYLEPAHPHVSRWDAPAARALDAAERFSTLAWLHVARPYPRAELDSAWKCLLFARDHNYGGKGAGGGQARKLAERRNVLHRSQVLLSQAMAAIAERVEAPRESVPIVVFNALNWERSDAVSAHVTFYPGADPAQRDVFPRGSALVLRDADGKPAPFQLTDDRRATTGELDMAFVARSVPGLGYACYTLEAAASAEAVAGEAQGTPGPRQVQQPGADRPEVTLENGAVRLIIERATGRARLLKPDSQTAVIDGLRLEGRREIPEVSRTPRLGLSLDDPAREQVESFVPGEAEPVLMLAEGPVLATAAVRGAVLGMPAEVRYTLYRNMPCVDVETWIDWDLRQFGRIELAYRVPLSGARAAYGLPFGAGAFGDEHLVPGSGPSGGDEGPRASWERTREICRWLDVANEAGGVAMATTHRWTRVDELEDRTLAVRCCLVRGGRMRLPDPAATGDDPRVRLGFRFRFYPHKGSWQEARVHRTGWEATQPLFAYTVNDTWSPKTLPRRQSLATLAVLSGKGDALATCFKQAEDGKGVVARWYEATGNPCQVQAAIPPSRARIERVNIEEKPVLDRGAAGAAADGSVLTWPWEIVTVRAQTSQPERK